MMTLPTDNHPNANKLETLFTVLNSVREELAVIAAIPCPILCREHAPTAEDEQRIINGQCAFVEKKQHNYSVYYSHQEKLAKIPLAEDDGVVQQLSVRWQVGYNKDAELKKLLLDYIRRHEDNALAWLTKYNKPVHSKDKLKSTVNLNDIDFESWDKVTKKQRAALMLRLSALSHSVSCTVAPKFLHNIAFFLESNHTDINEDKLLVEYEYAYTDLGKIIFGELNKKRKTDGCLEEIMEDDFYSALEFLQNTAGSVANQYMHARKSRNELVSLLEQAIVEEATGESDKIVKLALEIHKLMQDRGFRQKYMEKITWILGLQAYLRNCDWPGRGFKHVGYSTIDDCEKVTVIDFDDMHWLDIVPNEHNTNMLSIDNQLSITSALITLYVTPIEHLRSLLPIVFMQDESIEQAYAQVTHLFTQEQKYQLVEHLKNRRDGMLAFFKRQLPMVPEMFSENLGYGKHADMTIENWVFNRYGQQFIPEMFHTVNQAKHYRGESGLLHLFRTPEGQKILRSHKNGLIRPLESNSDLLNQVVQDGEFKGYSIAYYLYATEVGREILIDYPWLNKLIKPEVIAQTIAHGPDAGKNIGWHLQNQAINLNARFGEIFQDALLNPAVAFMLGKKECVEPGPWFDLFGDFDQAVTFGDTQLEQARNYLYALGLTDTEFSDRFRNCFAESNKVEFGNLFPHQQYILNGYLARKQHLHEKFKSLLAKTPTVLMQRMPVGAYKGQTVFTWLVNSAEREWSTSILKTILINNEAKGFPEFLATFFREEVHRQFFLDNQDWFGLIAGEVFTRELNYPYTGQALQQILAKSESGKKLLAIKSIQIEEGALPSKATAAMVARYRSDIYLKLYDIKAIEERLSDDAMKAELNKLNCLMTRAVNIERQVERLAHYNNYLAAVITVFTEPAAKANANENVNLVISDADDKKYDEQDDDKSASCVAEQDYLSQQIKHTVLHILLGTLKLITSAFVVTDSAKAWHRSLGTKCQFSTVSQLLVNRQVKSLPTGSTNSKQESEMSDADGNILGPDGAVDRTNNLLTMHHVLSCRA